MPRLEVSSQRTQMETWMLSRWSCSRTRCPLAMLWSWCPALPMCLSPVLVHVQWRRLSNLCWIASQDIMCNGAQQPSGSSQPRVVPLLPLHGPQRKMSWWRGSLSSMTMRLKVTITTSNILGYCWIPRKTRRLPGGPALKTNPFCCLWRLTCFLHCAVCFAKKLESHLSSAATLFFHWCCHTHFFQQTSFATMFERDQCSWLSHPTVITSSSLLASQGHVHTSGLASVCGVTLQSIALISVCSKTQWFLVISGGFANMYIYICICICICICVYLYIDMYMYMYLYMYIYTHVYV